MNTPTPESQNLPAPGSVEYANLAQTGSAPPLPSEPGITLAPVEPDTSEEPMREPMGGPAPSADRPGVHPPAGFPWWPPRPVPLPGVDSGLGL